MAISFYLLISLTLLFSTGYFFIQILKFVEERRKKKFDTVKSEFIADLYKLQQKWAKRGQFIYSQSLTIVIAGFNLPEKDEEAKSEEGRELARRMKQFYLEEMKEKESLAEEF